MWSTIPFPTYTRPPQPVWGRGPARVGLMAALQSQRLRRHQKEGCLDQRVAHPAYPQPSSGNSHWRKWKSYWLKMLESKSFCKKWGLCTALDIVIFARRKYIEKHGLTQTTWGVCLWLYINDGNCNINQNIISITLIYAIIDSICQACTYTVCTCT